MWTIFKSVHKYLNKKFLILPIEISIVCVAANCPEAEDRQTSCQMGESVVAESEVEGKYVSNIEHT